MNGCCADRNYGKGCNADTCMSLPVGKTCGDCVRFKSCAGFLGDRFSAANTSCDWFPRQFREAGKGVSE